MTLLFVEAVMYLALARLMVIVLPFRVLVRMLAGSPSAMLAGSPSAIRHPPSNTNRIRRALLAAARRAPWRSQCLEQSIAGKLMLRSRGIPATLYLGVEKRDDAIHAHAWLRCGSVFVVGGDGSSRFSVVSTLG